MGFSRLYLTTEQAVELFQQASYVSCWDFHTSLGDTLREKYESLVHKINEATMNLVRRGASGYFWLVTSPEIVAIFENACKQPSFQPAFGISPSIEPVSLGHGLNYCGVLNQRWAVYCCTEFPINNILIGCGSRPKVECCGSISVANFIV